MRFYETMFIVRPMTSEEEVKRRIDFFKDVILKNEGEIETCLDMGMRNMAYPINKHQRGYYFVVYFRANPGMISELERLYRINEDILRFIVIKYESKKEIKQWHTLVDRANKKPGSYTGFRKDKDEARTHESRNQAGKMKVESKEDSQKGGVEAL